MKKNEAKVFDEMARALATFAMCQRLKVKAPPFKEVGFVICLTSGRLDHVYEICSSFVQAAKPLLEAAEKKAKKPRKE